jgi:hypothetical protein
VCRSYSGSGSSTCHNRDTHCRNHSSRGRIRSDTAVDSKLPVANSTRSQGKRLEADNSKPVVAHNRAAEGLIRRPRPAPNRLHAIPKPPPPCHPPPPPCHAAWAVERDSAIAKATAAGRRRQSGLCAIMIHAPINSGELMPFLSRSEARWFPPGHFFDPDRSN